MANNLTDPGGAGCGSRRPQPAWVSWSSGKDSAWALHRALVDPLLDVRGLLTTVSAAFDRVSTHGVRRALLQAQAQRVGLPLHTVDLPQPCPNDVYEERFACVLQTAAEQGIRVLVFGDLFLADVRAYRERLLTPTGLRPHFPLWGEDTTALAAEMLEAGLEATITCVDPSALAPTFAGRRWDSTTLRDLPPTVDPCGERGEFHTFVTHSPDFSAPLRVEPGERVERDGFWFADLLPG